MFEEVGGFFYRNRLGKVRKELVILQLVNFFLALASLSWLFLVNQKCLPKKSLEKATISLTKLRIIYKIKYY